MFPSFLDGTSPTTIPDLLETVRQETNSADQDSFENHLQRGPDSKAAATDQDRDVNGGDVPARDEQIDANNTGHDEPHDARQEESTAAADEVAADREARRDDAEEDDAVLASDADAPTDPLADHEQPITLEAASGEVTSPAANAEEQAGLPGTAQAETRQAQSGSAPATEIGIEQKQGAEVANANNENVAVPTGEQVDTAPNSIAVDESQVVVVSPGEATVPSNTAGASSGKAKSDKRKGASEPLPGVAVESSDTPKQVLEATKAASQLLSAKQSTSVEATADPEVNATTHVALDGKSESATSTPHDRLAQQLIANGSERSSRAAPAGDINQTRFVDRVARAFRAVDSQGGTLKLRLHPPELGVLQVQLKVQGNALTAKLEAETPAARALLIDSLPVLRERLAEQGIQIEQFDVDLMERHPQDLPDGTDSDGAANQHGADIPEAAEESKLESTDDQPTQTDGGLNEQLNIIV